MGYDWNVYLGSNYYLVARDGVDKAKLNWLLTTWEVQQITYSPAGNDRVFCPATQPAGHRSPRQSRGRCPAARANDAEQRRATAIDWVSASSVVPRVAQVQILRVSVRRR